MGATRTRICSLSDAVAASRFVEADDADSSTGQLVGLFSDHILCRGQRKWSTGRDGRPELDQLPSVDPPYGTDLCQTSPAVLACRG
jgi:hypothetical protein